MTISSTRATEYTVDQIVTDAYIQAGIWSPTVSSGYPQRTQYLLYGRRRLNGILKASQVFTHAKYVSYYELTLTAGDYTYDMPSYVLDVIGDAKYIAADVTDTTAASSETVVIKIPREEWQLVSDRSSQATPTRYFADRQPTQIEINLHPVPEEAGTIRFQIHQLIADTLDGDATIEMEQFWYEYLIMRLAYILAQSYGLPMDRVSGLRRESERLRRETRGKANENIDSQVIVEHPTAWS